MATFPRVEGLVTLLIALLAFNVLHAFAAGCKTAVVGSPYNDCFDIYTAAKITAAQFATYNPGLNCSLLQPGQKVCISSGTLPSNAPQPSSNGTCATYTTVAGDSCAAIASKFDITTSNIETWNNHTYKWNGCSKLQVGFTMCVSSGNPPPIPVDPSLQCGPASPGNATCPLKACCSAFGFCGLTSDFCATTGPNPCISNCMTPTLPSCSGSNFTRNIGYWASWAARRPCAAFTPSQADWSSYTHAHFAFATITQDYQVLIADEDEPLLQELISVKTQVPGLKVILAVGGWAFSEADPTKDLFSLMISASSTRSTFISSVKSTLSNYGLDGIDIDFEYPGAVERNAPATDTPNLTAFFSELRSALPSTIISVAAPAGYWFLKGFQIDKIAPSVTYINMMSYDYHGPWDTNVTDQAPVANPHTSILDMRDSALLYVRAGIDLSKVNLGLAWYGRTFHLADKSCAGYNCTMVGGGAPGPCSDASGILAQFEVLDLIQEQGIKPTLDTPSETYWFDDESGDLVTFDQADTWAAKRKFAQNSCFGGSFVWSLDQVSQNGTQAGSTGSSSPGSHNLIPWNPNPHPAATAASATFVAAGSTTVIPVPSTTTIVSVGGNTIVLGPGGTPVNSLVPTGVTQPNAVTPTWTYNIVPPSSASSVTFTAPLTGFPTYTSVVGVPSASGAAASKVTGPPGDTNCDGSNQWVLNFGPSIQGCLPGDVGVPGGTTPSAVPPVGWIGPWTNPVVPHSVTTVLPISGPPISGSSTSRPSPSYTYITWNPNPYPPPTAISETFVRSSSTTIIPIPVVTTTVVLGGETVTVGPGGTVVNSVLPPDITLKSAITPVWTYDILPPPGATSVEFTAPLTLPITYSTVVPVPTSSNQPGNNVNGPPGDHGRCGSSNIWTVIFGGFIDGCLPLDVGIPGGITPYPLKPTSWVGSWPNPYPLATGGPPESGQRPTSTVTSSATTSSSASSAAVSGTCLLPQTTAYTLPDDPENQDWADDGTDPDNYRRRRRLASRHLLHSRVPPQTFKPRYIRVDPEQCANLNATSPTFVDLNDATMSIPWYHVPEDDSVSTNLVKDSVSVGAGRPDTGMTVQEHIFELGYIKQFFASEEFDNVDCTWIQTNFFDYTTIDGSQTISAAILAVIDNYNNMVWADKPINQAKSNVVNNNKDTSGNPPQKAELDRIADQYLWSNQDGINTVWEIEVFLRSFAALGQYFNRTSPIFKSIASQVQQILSEVTPTTAIDNSASLPAIFWRWLSTTLEEYPDGCTTRTHNAYNYYRTSMQAAALRQGLPTVDACFDLYWEGQINPSTFNYTLLLPTEPSAPSCHVPGTTAQITFASNSQNFWSDSKAYTSLGIGNIFYYGIGSGTSVNDVHWQFTQYQTSDACNGLYNIQNVAAGHGQTVGIHIDCDSNTAIPLAVTGTTSPQQVIPFTYCDLLVPRVIPGYELVCGSDQTSVSQCSSLLYNNGQALAWLVYLQNVGINLH